MQLIVFFPFFFFWKKQFINRIFLADPLILTGVFLAQIDQGAGNFLWDFGPYWSTVAPCGHYKTTLLD